MRRIEVVPYNPEWAKMFEEEALRIANALGENCLAVHHIGSTSIPGICAKPIIDFLVEVKAIEVVDACNDEMIKLGYTPRGEFGLIGRRYFPRIIVESEQHTHHVHVYQRGHPDVLRHLVFRDYMRAHPDDARAYGNLKARLAQQFPNDPEAYMDGKDAFVKAMERKAFNWQKNFTGR